MNRLDKYRGCLLGYPVEFDSRSEMLTHYGPGGVTDTPFRTGWPRSPMTRS